jgi:hypothetical protein
MSATGLIRGAPLVGFSNVGDKRATLPPLAESTDSIIATILERLNGLQILAEGAVQLGEIRSQIGLSDEAVLISGKTVAVAGEVTFVQLVNEQNGSTSGLIPKSISRIIGNMIQTGSIRSNNWSESEGSAFDLDNETLTLGGSSDPDFFYDGAGNLEIKGTLRAGSVVSSSVTITGSGFTLGGLAGHAGSGGNPHSTALDQIFGDLDDLDDGSIFFKTTAAEKVGGERASNALDASFDYVRALSTQKIIVTGAAPSSGTVIDNLGLRGYTSGVQTLNIPTTGAASVFAGDIVTAGKIRANGVNVDGSQIAAIFGIAEAGSGTAAGVSGSGNAFGPGIQGFSFGTGDGVQGGAFGTLGNGVYGLGATAGTKGAYFGHIISTAAGGVALETFSGLAKFGDDIQVIGDINHSGGLASLADVDINGLIDVIGNIVTANLANARLEVFGDTDNVYIDRYRFRFITV